jgi:hypothetical protein
LKNNQAQAELLAIDEVIKHDGIMYWLYSENYDSMFHVLQIVGTSQHVHIKYQLLLELIKNALLLLVLKDRTQPPFVDFSDEMATIQQKIAKFEQECRQVS